MAKPRPRLRIEIAPQASLPASQIDQILALVSRAYGQDLSTYYQHLRQPMHLLGFVDGRLVSHACWIDRHLRVGDAEPIRTAYVELVATAPEAQGRGYATSLMKAFPGAVAGYGLAALCPEDQAVSLYRRLGWQWWCGPLSIREGERMIPTPGERIMYLPLPLTPRLDPHLPLSAEWRPGEMW